ncbi:MAG: HAD family phosphatase [Candidatus Gastranaerophilales bacterium]|nr:HAD family phosphatase [Candidatus Gastranaerophilales bacterium]
MIKAIIFDMDGVLVDAKDWHYEALNKALELFGFTISKYEHLVTYDGLPTSRKLEMLSLERGLPKGLHKFINRMKQFYTIELIFNKCKPVFYHEYALSNLKDMNYKLAVASNSVRQTVDLMMQKSKLQRYLDFSLSNEDVEDSKPNPEIYIKAIEKFGVKPEECLIVEDNENGIRAAKASGANLLIVESIQDVNLKNILGRIKEIEGELCEF